MFSFLIVKIIAESVSLIQMSNRIEKYITMMEND